MKIVDMMKKFSKCVHLRFQWTSSSNHSQAFGGYSAVDIAVYSGEICQEIRLWKAWNCKTLLGSRSQL